MFISFILTLMLLMNILFTLMIHPLAITLMIILQTIFICSITGINSYSFWFSYILFLIFLGGMLVLFIYITSLASNEMFQLPIKIIIILLGMMLISNSILLLMNHFMLTPNHKNDSITLKSINLSSESINLNQLYNYPNFIMTIMTIMYLLLTLIIIVKITQIQEGPLRHSN